VSTNGGKLGKLSDEQAAVLMAIRLDQVKPRWHKVGETGIVPRMLGDTDVTGIVERLIRMDWVRFTNETEPMPGSLHDGSPARKLRVVDASH
jgi:hypothetical protein